MEQQAAEFNPNIKTRKSKIFEKIQKHPSIILNPIVKDDIEKKQLAQQIGIDYEIEKEKFEWFLNQVI